jgi:hypothetical protein
LDLKGRTYQEAVENCIMRSFTMRSAYMISECLKGRDHLEDLGIDGRIMLKLSQINRNRRVWTGLIWLMAVTSGWLL